jgi:glyoxylase-like metal-dependent hydrolase (beta-lactamase superfamily II)
MLKQIHKNIYLAGGKNNGRFPFSNSVLIKDRITALIDTGCGINVMKALKKELKPEIVILSHSHPDHCSGAGLFSPERIYSPYESKETIGDLNLMANRFISPALHNAWISFIKQATEFIEFKAGHSFGANHVFDLGNTIIEAVHAPGHINDHYCFYLPNEKIMLTTDIDFTSFGPWYANPESDIDKFIHSIGKIRSYAIKTTISSHKGIIRRKIQEKFDRFLACFQKRDEMIMQFLRIPRSLEDFTEKALIYHKYSSRTPILKHWETGMITKHLQRLISKNLVQRKEGMFFRTF